MVNMRTILGNVAALLVIGVAVGAPDDVARPAEKHKRQIFREQVLPHAGGKIPADAFRADRLALNRLNKDGISVPDGVLLDARRRVQHPQTQQGSSDLERSVIRVVLTPDGRYVPPEGKYRDEHARTIESTYVIRPPIGSHKYDFQRYPKHKSYVPIRTKLELPSKSLKFPTFHRRPKDYGFRPSGNFVFQNQHYGGFSDYFDPFLNSPETFSSLESFFDEFNNGRFVRQSEWKPVVFPSERRVAESYQQQVAGSKVTDRGKLHPTLPDLDEGFVCRETGGEERMYSDITINCQGFHVCRKSGRKDSFYCPAETLFSNALQRCVYKNSVECR